MSEIVHIHIFLGVLFITSGCQWFISAPSFIPYTPLSFSSSSFSVPSPTLHLYCKLQFPLQNITLNIFFPFHFLQALINPAWPPTRFEGFCTAQGDPETPCRLLRGESGIPQDEASPLDLLAPCFLGSIPTGKFANIEGKAKEMVSCSSVHKSNFGSSPPSLWSDVNVTLCFLVTVNTFRKVRYKVQVEYSWGFSCLYSG